MEKTDETTFSCVLTREGSFGFASGDLKASRRHRPAPPTAARKHFPAQFARACTPVLGGRLSLSMLESGATSRAQGGRSIRNNRASKRSNATDWPRRFI
jgi:hypothetical protein